jgi:LPXTG-motif cell wall-anchored protein
MRTHLNRASRLIAATGLALAVSPLALASIAAAATNPTPSPTIPVPPSPSSTPSAPTTKPPAEPLPKAVDASVTATAKVHTEVPPMAIVKFVVRSDKPVASYRLKIKLGWPGTYAAPPNHPGWDCTGEFKNYDCHWTGKATAEPAPVSLALSHPDAPGSFAQGTVTTTESDSNPANNTARTKVIVPEPAAKTGTLTGRVWNDANHNGRQDKGEKGVRGARIVLTFGPGDSTTKVYGPVATGADGRYVIRKIEPNVPGVSGFTVAVATPGKGWTFTKPGIGADRGDSDFHRVDARGEPLETYLETYFGKNATVGMADWHDIKAGETAVLDAGLIHLKSKPGAGADDTLPKTGAATGAILAAGGLLLGGGIALTVLARRRRATTE